MNTEDRVKEEKRIFRLCLTMSFALSLRSAKVKAYFGVDDKEFNSVPLFLILVCETIVLNSDIDGLGNKSILQWW